MKTNATYAYDNMDRLFKVFENGQLLATYGYDANGNRTSLEYANGDSTQYIYTKANKIKQLTNSKGGQVLSQYIYYYDAVGNRIYERDGLTSKATFYTYDGVGRLAKVEPAGEPAITYTYDDRNNRRKVTVQGVSTTSYEYDPNNRLTTETKTAGEITEITRYGYDSNGNQTYKATETIKPAVDGENEEYTVTVVGEDPAGTNVTINEYDGLNRNIQCMNK